MPYPVARLGWLPFEHTYSRQVNGATSSRWQTVSLAPRGQLMALGWSLLLQLLLASREDSSAAKVLPQNCHAELLPRNWLLLPCQLINYFDDDLIRVVTFCQRTNEPNHLNKPKPA